MRRRRISGLYTAQSCSKYHLFWTCFLVLFLFFSSFPDLFPAPCSAFSEKVSFSSLSSQWLRKALQGARIHHEKRVFSRVFSCFLVFSMTQSPHPVVLLWQEPAESDLLVTFCTPATNSTTGCGDRSTLFMLFPLFSRVFSCFLLFSCEIQAAPLITLRESGQKAAFGHKRQLLTVSSQSDEWAGLILMPGSCFSREKHIFYHRGKWCIPISFSDQKSCVKGGVFFPIQDIVFYGSGSARIQSGQNCQIQGALAYTR